MSGVHKTLAAISKFWGHKGAIKQVPYSGPKNIRCDCTKLVARVTWRQELLHTWVGLHSSLLVCGILNESLSNSY